MSLRRGFPILIQLHMGTKISFYPSAMKWTMLEYPIECFFRQTSFKRDVYEILCVRKRNIRLGLFIINH